MNVSNTYPICGTRLLCYTSQDNFCDIIYTIRRNILFEKNIRLIKKTTLINNTIINKKIHKVIVNS